MVINETTKLGMRFEFWKNHHDVSIGMFDEAGQTGYGLQVTKSTLHGETRVAEGVFENDKIQNGIEKSFDNETRDHSGMFCFTSEAGSFQL